MSITLHQSKPATFNAVQLKFSRRTLSGSQRRSSSGNHRHTSPHPNRRRFFLCVFRQLPLSGSPSNRTHMSLSQLVKDHQQRQADRKKERGELSLEHTRLSLEHGLLNKSEDHSTAVQLQSEAANAVNELTNALSEHLNEGWESYLMLFFRRYLYIETFIKDIRYFCSTKGIRARITETRNADCKVYQTDQAMAHARGWV